tara:strand:+ start:35 stop:526 length:492 start_codon:yes stop_codon:yes gene_type:complete
MIATLNRDSIAKRYEEMSANGGFTSIVETDKLSTEFMKARIDYADWYDNKSEETQELIDEISDRTSYIIDEDEYDGFMEELSSYGITTSTQFEDAFRGEFEGYGERVCAQFAEDWVDDIGELHLVPEYLQHAIDYELVWYSSIRYDFMEVEFKGNTYFFHNHF